MDESDGRRGDPSQRSLHTVIVICRLYSRVRLSIDAKNMSRPR